MSSLRDLLRGVPQDARFHPEGDVWTHVKLVRDALDAALEMTRELFPDLGSPPDRNLLRAAAWAHDLGKASATRLINGRHAAPGHETAAYVNKIARRLGVLWRDLWRSGGFEDRKTLAYLVTRHMGVCDACGLHPKIARVLESKRPTLRRRARLVVTFMAMDRLGCGSASREADARIVIDAAGHTNSRNVTHVWCGRSNCWSATCSGVR